MNKSQALELLNEILANCQSMNVGGFYTRPIRTISADNVELRLITSLDVGSRKRLARIIAGHGLKMIEDSNLVIIYESK